MGCSFRLWHHECGAASQHAHLLLGEFGIVVAVTAGEELLTARRKQLAPTLVMCAPILVFRHERLNAQ
jgi:hypothetical protein